MGAVDGLQLVVAIAAAIGGVLLLARRTAVASGSLLLATAAAIPFTQAAQPTGSLPLALTLLLDGSAPALAAAAGVLWPVARTALVDRVVCALAVACTLVLGGLAPMLLYDPVANGCNACAPNLLEVHPDAGLADLLARAGAASALVWGPAVVLIGARRVWRASRLARRQAWPVAGGVLIAVLAAVSSAHGLALPTGATDPEQRGLWSVQAALIGLLALAAHARVYLAGTAGRRMARIVLAAMPDQAVVVASLRQATADPSLDVWYVRADAGVIDPDGASADPWDGPALRLSRGEHVFAQVRHDPLTGSALLRSSAASAGLALEYLAAQARLRAELRSAAEVRSRIVQEGGAERRRLERNLHDGAQQRLVALGLILTATGLPLDVEHAEVDAALRELRTIARGLFPAGMSERGVRTALRELGDHTVCPLVVSGEIDEPVSLAVKTAVYQLVSDVSEAHPTDTALHVDLAGGGAESVEVTLTTTMADLTDLRSRVLHAEDRFVASGGRVTVRASGAGAIVHGEVPCAS